MNRPSPPSSKNECDPLRDPRTAFGKLDEVSYKAELDLVDRYQLFVAEMLRLSLAGLGIFGFIYEKIFSPNVLRLTAPCAIQAKSAAALGLFSFSICAASALVFRYFATEGARYYIQALRYASSPDARDARLSKESLETRRKRVKICKISKASSAFFLGLGGFSIAASFCFLLLSSATHKCPV